MKDEFYKITKKLGVEQLKDFIPNTLPEDIFCVLKRVHHQTNQSQAGNLYSYYKYEFLDVIGNGIQFTIRDTVLVLSSEERVTGGDEEEEEEWERFFEGEYDREVIRGSGI